MCLLISSDEGGENDDSLNVLLKRHKDCFPLAKKKIKGLLKSSREKVEEYSGIYNVNLKMNGNHDVFHFALRQSKDVDIDDTDPEFKKRLPKWYQEKINAPAFVLYPIVVNKRPVGLVYADRELPGRVISGNQFNYMKTLCNQAVLAIKQRR